MATKNQRIQKKLRAVWAGGRGAELTGEAKRTEERNSNEKEEKRRELAEGGNPLMVGALMWAKQILEPLAALKPRKNKSISSLTSSPSPTALPHYGHPCAPGESPGSRLPASLSPPSGPGHQPPLLPTWPGE